MKLLLQNVTEFKNLFGPLRVLLVLPVLVKRKSRSWSGNNSELFHNISQRSPSNKAEERLKFSKVKK